MAQYRVGTASVNNGSAAVTGTGTKWQGNISAGWMFIFVGDSTFYQIASITNNTSITLSTNYSGSNQVNASYVIVRDYSYNFAWPVVTKGSANWSIILEEALRMIDSNLYETPANKRIKSITFEPQASSPTIEEGKLYYDDGANTFVFWNGTEWREVSSTAL